MIIIYIFNCIKHTRINIKSLTVYIYSYNNTSILNYLNKNETLKYQH